MMLERQQLRLGRPRLDLFQFGMVLGEIMALFRAMTHQEKMHESDTSIAWEDGEADSAEARPADGH